MPNSYAPQIGPAVGKGLPGLPTRNPPPADTSDTVNTWARPTDWLELPTVLETDQKLVGLVAIFPDSNFLALSANVSSGTYSVNWGDGTSTTGISSGVQTNKQYTYSTPALVGTECSRGYRQAIVTITPDSGNLIAVNLNLKHTQASLNSYSPGWLDVAIAGSLTSLVVGGSTVYNSLLERFRNIGTNTITSFLNIFNYCYNLRAVELYTSFGTNFTNAFGLCYALETVPMLDLSNATTCNTMFSDCRALRKIPLFNTSKCATFTSMFSNCWSLSGVPLLNTSSGTNFSSMFSGCRLLSTVPLFNLSAGLFFTGMFNNCQGMEYIPDFNVKSGTDFTSMFSSCSSLKVAPNLNFTAAGINCTTMFQNCSKLKTIPFYNTATVTNMNNMFANCYGLRKVPDLNTALVTDFSGMFSFCSSLESVPNLNTSSGTQFTGMFSSCLKLQEIPALDTSKATGLTSMFANCVSLTTVPQLNLAKATQTGSMFSGCQSLTTLPSTTSINLPGTTTNASAVIAMSDTTGVVVGMAVYGQNIPANAIVSSIVPSTSVTISAAATAAGTVLVSFVPYWCVRGSTIANMFNLCSQLSESVIYGISNTHTWASKLSSIAIANILENVFPTVAAPALVFSSNWGRPTAVSSAGTSTSGSTSVTVTSTTGMIAGRAFAAVNLGNTAIACTNTPANTVTKVGHGLPNGTKIVFSSITTGVGVYVRTIYYVINAAADTFQLAVVSGGTAISFSFSAASYLFYNSIVSVDSGTTLTVAVPATASGATTVAVYPITQVRDAQLKGWTITA